MRLRELLLTENARSALHLCLVWNLRARVALPRFIVVPPHRVLFKVHVTYDA